jgi:hypothetical protein
MLNAVMLSVIMLCVVILNVVMLNLIMLSVVAPENKLGLLIYPSFLRAFSVQNCFV